MATDYTIICGDALTTLRNMKDESVNTCITSPPYYSLRDYGAQGQIGVEDSPEAYIDALTEVFLEVKRVLRPDGTRWVNIGDCYCGTGHKGKSRDPKYSDGRSGQIVSKTTKFKGLKDKDMAGIPWLLAIRLRDAGYHLRQDIIWAKPNPMPESVLDRCTRSHEYIFLLSKSKQYYFDNAAIKEQAALGTKASKDGLRNKRDVWCVPTAHYGGAHFATYPTALIEPCVLAGCPAGGIVLDPFSGAGTTGVVALNNERNYIGIEINPEYAALQEQRLRSERRQNGNEVLSGHHG